VPTPTSVVQDLGLGPKPKQRKKEKTQQPNRPLPRHGEKLLGGKSQGLGRSRCSPEVQPGLTAEAAPQASVIFPAPGAGCCEPAQGSELLGTDCVLAVVGTPHGSTEAACLAPVARQDQNSEVNFIKFRYAGVRKHCGTYWGLCPVPGEVAIQRAVGVTQQQG
jgi:hypothetical protein